MPAQTIRVLCADDHRLMREGIARIVNVQPDMEVVAEASNGEQAVAQFLASRPDVTLMDLQLPGTSGPAHEYQRRDIAARDRQDQPDQGKQRGRGRCQQDVQLRMNTHVA